MREVVQPYRDVQKLIRADLLNPRLLDLSSLVESSESEEAPSPDS